MDIEDGPIGIRLRGQKSAMSPLLAEVDCYLHLLVLLHLLDVEQQDEAVACSEELMIKLSNYNRRSLDHVAARCYYYHTLSHESKGQMSKIRGFLHGKLRTATLNVSIFMNKPICTGRIFIYIYQLPEFWLTTLFIIL